jgi:hypothetical protein
MPEAQESHGYPGEMSQDVYYHCRGEFIRPPTHGRSFDVSNAVERRYMPVQKQNDDSHEQ